MQYAQAALALARLPNFDTQAVSVEHLQSRHQLIEIARHPLYGNQLYLDGDLQISESDQIYGTTMASPISAILLSIGGGVFVEHT